MAPKKEWKTLEDSSLYTVGWIAALAHERAAALVLLDERHNKPTAFRQNKSDDNSYSWGRISGHNVVVASLPAGEYGLVSAASTASGLLSSLPHLRIGLFVGIGAGVPHGDSILLGDIVVSSPDGTNGGVAQYDLYKSKTIVASGDEPSKVASKERKGFLNSPPRVLRSALNALRAEHEIGGSAIQDILQAFYDNKATCKPYCYPGSDEDLLRQRIADPRVSPVVHYGTIASGNTLLKNASERDELVKWFEDDNIHPLCFEMEAAGLMNSFPCVVIRGICDYADEHKNDVWQKYAAATAAAFAKELLGYIEDDEVEETAKIGNIISNISDLRLDIQKGISNVRSDMTAERERSLLQARLDVAKGASYNSYTNEHTATCLEGTRIALLQQIRDWTNDPSGKCIFWLCGKAGMGKSTVARTVAKSLDESRCLGASFFFKRGEDDRKNAAKFFPTLVMTLTETVPGARRTVAHALEADATLCARNLTQQFDELLLGPLIAALSQGGSPRTLIIVIDALDECENEQEIRLILGLLSRLHDVEGTRIRTFVTSRPELPVLLGFGRVNGKLHEDVKLEEVQEGTIENDIRTYLESQFREIRERASVRSYSPILDNWPGTERINTLVELAVPLFIFAFTVCRYVAEKNSIKRLQTILNQNRNFSFSELGKTYVPILQHLILDQDVRDHNQSISQFRKVVGAIILLADPLSAESLSNLLEIDIVDIEEALSGLHSVLDIPKSRHQPIRLLHLSFRDFLVNTQETDVGKLSVEEAKTHGGLATQCLHRLECPSILRQDICNVKAPGTRRIEIDRRRISDCIPADIAYACCYWVSHTVQSKQKLSDGSEVHHFLQRHFLHWLEALSWLGRLSSAVGHLTQLATHVKAGEGHELMTFLDDALRFLLMNKYVIDLAPIQLYHSALIFTPKNSIIRQAFLHEMLATFTMLPEAANDWSAERLRIRAHEASMNPKPINSVACSPDGRLLASGGEDGFVRIWDIQTGEEKPGPGQRDSFVNIVAFPPVGDLLASASRFGGGKVQLWNLLTAEEERTFSGLRNTIDTMAFSPDGKLLASASSWDYIVQLWVIPEGKECATFAANSLTPDQYADSGVSALTFSPDGTVLACASWDTTIYLWDILATEHKGSLQDNKERATAIAFAPKHKYSLHGHKQRVDAMAFAPDGKVLASASNYVETIRLWDLTTREEVQLLKGHSRGVTAVMFSPNGKLFASSSWDRTVRLWNTTTGLEMQRFEGHVSDVNAVAFTPDGRLLISASYDGTIRVWNTLTNYNRPRLQGHSTRVTDLVLSPDGHLLVSASEDGTVRSWDISGAEEKRIFDGHSGAVRSVTLSSGNRLLASASSDRTILLWDLATGAIVHRLAGHQESVNKVAFSPDGEILASASIDRTVRIWSVGKGEEIWSIRDLDQHAVDLAFSPDGKFLASCFWSGFDGWTDDSTSEEWQKNNICASIYRMEFCTPGVLSMSLHCKTYDSYLLSSKGVRKGFDMTAEQYVVKFDGKPIEFRVAERMQHESKQRGATLGVNGEWPQHNGEDLLWLPREYQHCSYVAHGNTLVVGQTSGAVSFFKI